MNYNKRTPRHFAFLAIFCSLFVLGSCGYDKSETDYENEIEAAENEVGDPMLKNQELSNEGVENDSLYDSDQPARIDGQEGHIAPADGEEDDYENSDH